MKGIEGVLKEELERLEELEKSYLRQIQGLPKGSVQKKKIKDNSYPYLVFRDGADVVYEYMGKLSNPALKKLESEIELRRKYEGLLREVRQNIARLKQIVYGRKRSG